MATPSNETIVLSVENISHSYASRASNIDVVSNVSFTVARSEIVAVGGDSGSGKTTLLLACGAMQMPTEGSIFIQGQNIYDISASGRVDLRANKIGYMFQTLELIPYLSVLANVRISKKVDHDSALHWLSRLGMKDRLAHKPEALSHGQRQRVALARAIAHEPVLLIADEPTGNLDQRNSDIVFDALNEYAKNGGAVLVASHDPHVNEIANRVYRLSEATSQLAEVSP